MRKPVLLLYALAIAGPVAAQQWEIGGAGGVGIFQNLSVTGAAGSATTGFKPGVAFSAFAGQQLYRHLGGEFRYTFQFDDMKLSAGGTETSFSAVTHSVEYDLVYEGNREGRVWPFVAGGGGVRDYRGTGTEHAVQPLLNFAALTKTSQVEGLISAGGGLKWRVGERGLLRAEVRAFFTPAPSQVIAPTTAGGKLGGWVKEVMPMLGLGFTF